METGTQAILAGWGDFYVITGAAAATLTGLQFVTQSLLASGRHRAAAAGDPTGGIDAFGTPTVVHLTNALLVSAIMCVPWSAWAGLRGTLAVLGVGALGYSAIVLGRARRQRVYVPVAEDWIWHVVLPAAAYAAVLLAAVLFGGGAEAPRLVVAAATLLLLCIGIHNAWDTFTYLTLNTLQTGVPEGDAAPRASWDPKPPSERE